MVNKISIKTYRDPKKCPVCRSEKYQFAPGINEFFCRTPGDYVICSNCNVVYLRRDE